MTEEIIPTTWTSSPARVFSDLGLAVAVDPAAERQGVNQRWIPLVPLGRFEHPQYGNLDITAETIREMQANHQAGLFGIDLPIDIDHSWGGSSEAAGWLISTEVRGDGLWGLVEFNDWGLSLVTEKRFRYISPEWYPDWKDPQTGEYHHNVLTSVALTNRPFFKSLPALLASEGEHGRTYIAYQFVWEEKGEEIWHRVRDPGDFREDTFRSKDMPGVKGVRMILGKLKPENVAKDADPDAMALQALRFDAKMWTMERAKAWVAEHKDRLQAAAPAADDIRRGAAETTGGNHMPDDPTKKPVNSDLAPKTDPGATPISMAEFTAAKAEAAAARTEAAAATKAAAEANARLDLAQLKERIGAFRFGEDKRGALAPAMVEQLAATALRFAAGDEREKYLKSLEGLSFVELGERGVGGGDAGGDTDAKLQAAITAKRTANPAMTFGDAFRAVAAEQPALIQARDADIAAKQPALRGSAR